MYNMLMIRTQIQLPESLYHEAKRIAREQEMPLAEVLRRGLEHMRRIYPQRQLEENGWRLPAAKSLGEFRAPLAQWREAANPPPVSSKS